MLFSCLSFDFGNSKQETHQIGQIGQARQTDLDICGLFWVGLCFLFLLLFLYLCISISVNPSESVHYMYLFLQLASALYFVSLALTLGA